MIVHCTLTLRKIGNTSRRSPRSANPVLRFEPLADLALLDLASGGGSVALGVIHLEPPPYLGEVVFAGTWTDLARLEVSRGLFSTLRRTVQTSRRRVPLWAYGASRSWRRCGGPSPRWTLVGGKSQGKSSACSRRQRRRARKRRTTSTTGRRCWYRETKQYPPG